jgi:hypothetical protein
MTNCSFLLHSKLNHALLPLTFHVLAAVTKKNTVHCYVVQSDENLPTTYNKSVPPVSR